MEPMESISAAGGEEKPTASLFIYLFFSCVSVNRHSVKIKCTRCLFFFLLLIPHFKMFSAYDIIPKKHIENGVRQKADYGSAGV